MHKMTSLCCDLVHHNTAVILAGSVCKGLLWQCLNLPATRAGCRAALYCLHYRFCSVIFASFVYISKAGLGTAVLQQQEHCVSVVVSMSSLKLTEQALRYSKQVMDVQLCWSN
ncbi:TPA: hypothetical protein ACH3X1_005562 [Trebouxia sp. C0004]